MTNIYDEIEKYYNRTELEAGYKENCSEDDKIYSGYLKNLRDIKKLLNAFNFHYQLFKKKNIHINISDLFLITAIKTFNHPLWEKIYEYKETITLNKKPFTDERYISENHNLFVDTNENSLYSWKYKISDKSDNEESFIELSKLKSFEVGIIQSLFPYNRSMPNNQNSPMKPSSFYSAMSDHKIYSSKRIKDSLKTFMLYFQFNPAESHLNDILESLENYHLNPDGINAFLNTDTDYSDLFDIVVTNLYKNYRTPQTILNILDLILKRNDIYDVIYQDETNFIFSPSVDKMDAIPIFKVKDLIISNRDFAIENFDAFVVVIYDLFMYTKGRSERKDIRTELTADEKVVKKELIDWLANIFHMIDFLKMSRSTLWTLYYSYQWENMIILRVNEIVENSESEYLLDFIMHFASEGQSTSVPGDGKFYGVSFLFENLFVDCYDALKNKLTFIQKIDHNLMKNNKYVAYFGETGTFEKEPNCHLVDYALKVLDLNNPVGFERTRIED